MTWSDWGKAARAMALGIFLFAGVVLGQGMPNLPPPRLQPPPSAPPAAGPAAGSTAPATGGPVSGSTAAAPAAPSKPLPVVTISAQVDRPQVPRDETVKLMITLTWTQPAAEPSQPLDFEFPNPPAAEGLTLFANSFNSTTELSGHTVSVQRAYTYEFRAEKEGKTEIKPVSLNYLRIGEKEKKALATQALPVTVTKPALHLRALTRNPAALAALAAVIVIALAALAWPWIKARRAPKPEAAPLVSPHELARNRLREVDRLRMGGDYEQFLLLLSAEVNRYLEDALKVRARGVSGDKLAAAVAEKFGPEWRERMLELHKLWDKVKFAGYQPNTREMDQALDTAKALVAEGERSGAQPAEKTTEN